MSQPRALSPPAALTRSTPWLSRRSARRALARAAVYLCLGGGAVLILIPLLWMLSLSFMTLEQALRFPPEWIPNPFVPIWRNMARTLETQPFGLYAVNTSRIVAFSLVGQVLSSALVAFGFARLRARWRSALFLVLLASMMLPSQVTWLSLYVMFSRIGWVNTYLPLVVPYYFASPFFVFLRRQFFLTIPIALDEAARIDGASSLRVYWHIFMPTAGPVLAAMTIMVFMLVWKEYFLPLIYLNKSELFTLALGIQFFRGFADYATQWHLLMAASTAIALPPLALFLFCQRYFIQGLTMTGLKA